jgi:hypothetical protein
MADNQQSALEPTPTKFRPTLNMMFSDIAGMTRFRQKCEPTYLTDSQTMALMAPICAARRADRLTAREFRRLTGSELRDFCRRHQLQPVQVRLAQTVATGAWTMQLMRRLAARIADPKTEGGMQ